MMRTLAVRDEFLRKAFSPSAKLRHAFLESADLMREASGVPAQVSVKVTADNAQDTIAAIPFRKLRDHLTALDRELALFGGGIDRIDYRHRDCPGLTAHDIYRLGDKSHIMGFRLDTQTVLNDRAHNVLVDGSPFVLPKNRMN